MNAGAYDGEIKQVLKSVTLLTPEKFSVSEVPAEELDLGYRHSRINIRNSPADSLFTILQWNTYISDDTMVEQLNSLRYEWENQLSGIERYSDKLATLKEKGNYTACIDGAKKVIAARQVMLDKEQVIKDLLKLNIKDKEEDWLGGKKELIRLLDEHFNELRDWITYTHKMR